MLKSIPQGMGRHPGLLEGPATHDMASHGSDAFRYLACAYRDYVPPPPPPKPKEARTDARGIWVTTVDELLKIHEGPKGGVRV